MDSFRILEFSLVHQNILDHHVLGQDWCMNECSFVYHHHNLLYMCQILTSHSNHRQLKHYHNSQINTEVYSEPCQTFKMEPFAKIVNGNLFGHNQCFETTMFCELHHYVDRVNLHGHCFTKTNYISLLKKNCGRKNLSKRTSPSKNKCFETKTLYVIQDSKDCLTLYRSRLFPNFSYSCR